MRLTLALSALLLAWGAVLGADAPANRSLNEVLEGYRGLSLGQSGLPVTDRKIEVGRLQMTFKTGTLFPLVGNSGEVLGFLFEGQGQYGYKSEETGDQAVFALNLKRVLPALVPAENTVWDNFEHALVFTAKNVVPELESPTGAAPDARARDSFARIWKRVGLTYLPYEHLAAQARLNSGKLQYVYAEFEGAKGTVGYALDQVHTFDEGLFAFRKIQGIDLRFPETLSEQDATLKEESDVTARLVDANISVATSDNKTGTIVSDLTFEVERDGLRVLPLSLMNNRSETSYDWKATKNVLRVTKVLDESGKAVPFSHQSHQILVQLPRAMSRSDHFRLHFETEGEIFTNLNGSRDDSYFLFLGGGWYPSPYDQSFFTYVLKVHTKKPWRPIASGTTVELKEDDSSYQLETRSTKPSRILAVLGGNYKVNEEKIGNITYRVHGYAMARKQVMEGMPRLADGILRFYESKLGPYPFEELDIVEIPAYGFGIAPSGVVLITTEAYRPYLESEAEYLSGGINNRLAHEIAHQWFPHKAAPRRGEDLWLSESFAEYLAGMAMAAMNPDERQVKGFKGMMAQWKGNAKECTGAPLDQAGFLGGEHGGEDYRCLVYNRGPLVLHMFRANLGDQAFYAVLKKILDDASFDLIDLDDVKAAQKAVLRTDMGWFFDEWAHKAGIPQVRVKHAVEGSVLSGKVEQTPDAFIKMTIPFIIDYPDGKRDVRVLLQDDWSKDFRFELPAAPSKVTVDPANNNLAVYR